jgi:hypothetical protein
MRVMHALQVDVGDAEVCVLALDHHERHAFLRPSCRRGRAARVCGAARSSLSSGIADPSRPADQDG